MVLNKLVDIVDVKSVYQMFFLKDDVDLSVEILETRSIDFDEVLLCLDRGGSVFITAEPVHKTVKTQMIMSLDEFAVA
jgi:hypothetical protein